MNDCIFCKIRTKEVPAHIVYEDDGVLAFLDIHPVNPGHTLVIPKSHVGDFLAADDDTVAQVSVAARRIAAALVLAKLGDGCNIIVNNGIAAGQVVPHLHLHVIPRRGGDGLTHWPGTPYAPGVAEETAQQITALV